MLNRSKNRRIRFLPPHQKAPGVNSGMNGVASRSASPKAMDARPSQPKRPLRRSRLSPWCGGLLFSLAVFLWLGTVSAEAATLYLSPAAKTVVRGSTLVLSARVNTGADPVNAVQTNLIYSPAHLKFLRIDGAASAFPIEAESAGGEGVIRIARGKIPPPVTGDALVANVVFQVLSDSGSSPVVFAESSAVLRSTDNTNVLTARTGGTYTFTAPAPPPPPPTSPPAPPEPTGTPVSEPAPTPLPEPTPEPTFIPEPEPPPPPSAWQAIWGNYSRLITSAFFLVLGILVVFIGRRFVK